MIGCFSLAKAFDIEFAKKKLQKQKNNKKFK